MQSVLVVTRRAIVAPRSLGEDGFGKQLHAPLVASRHRPESVCVQETYFDVVQIEGSLGRRKCRAHGCDTSLLVCHAFRSSRDRRGVDGPYVRVCIEQGERAGRVKGGENLPA
jgi:hypothetical protein